MGKKRRASVKSNYRQYQTSGQIDIADPPPKKKPKTKPKQYKIMCTDIKALFLVPRLPFTFNALCTFFQNSLASNNYKTTSIV